MNRITGMFEAAKKEGRKALVGYLTAGDPDLVASERAMRAALENGVDLLEIGVPFSDPTADGPAIQAAGARALKAGATLGGIIGMAGRLRAASEAPMILFSYANPLFHYGYERVADAALAAGVDGFLVVDMPFEESGEFEPILAARGLCLIPLVAPTTPEQRMREILRNAGGFVYYIMVKGVTGRRTDVPPDVKEHIEALRRCTKLPIAAGFGVGNAAQAKAAAAHADAVVVGSALVEAAARGRLEELVRELAGAIRG